MKKVCGGLTGCLVILVMSMSCTGTKKEPKAPTASKSELAPIQIVIDKKGYESTSKAPSSNDDASCQQDSDCIVIPSPTNACIPCSGTAGQEPVSRSAAKRIMAPEKETCMPMLQELQKSKKGPTKSKHESCSFNGAKCVEGTCELAKLSEDELKALMPNMPRGQAPQAPQAPQGGQDSMGTSPEVSGEFPIEPRNGGARFDQNQFSGTGIPSRYGQDTSTSSQPAFRFGGAANQLDGSRAPQGYGRPSTFPAYREQASFGGVGSR